MSSSSPVSASSQEDQKSSINDLLNESFPPFDHQSIVHPFEQEKLRDIEYEKEMTRMIIDVLIQFHAWSSVRPMRERNLTALKLENQINAVLKVEEEQGTFISQQFCRLLEMTRERLLRFIIHMRDALATLAGSSR